MTNMSRWASKRASVSTPAPLITPAPHWCVREVVVRVGAQCEAKAAALTATSLTHLGESEATESPALLGREQLLPLIIAPEGNDGTSIKVVLDGKASVEGAMLCINVTRGT